MSFYGFWKSLNRKFWEEEGQTIAIVAVALSVLAIAFLAIGIDVANLFHAKRMAQAAADAAAISAAQQAKFQASMTTSSQEQQAAYIAAKLNGYDVSASTNAAKVTLNNPPSQGNYATGTNAASYIEAIVSKPVPTYFMGIFSSSYKTVTVSARAVAGVISTSKTCVHLYDQGDDALNMSNNAKLIASGCAVEDDSTSSSSATVVGSASVTAGGLLLASSTWTASSNVNNGGTLNSTPVTTGYSGTQYNNSDYSAPSYSNCSSDPITGTQGGATYSVGPSSSSGTICYSTLTIGANGDAVTLNPGIYVINGGSLHFESGTGGYSNLGGTGVMFYLTNGASITIDNGANVQLSAMTTGTYAGVLIYQDPSDSNAINLQGGSSAKLTGSIVAPTAAVSIGNGGAMTLNGGIYAYSLTITGGATVNAVTLNNGIAVGSKIGLVE